jgi:DNA-binding transcriptional LysR family regulator
VTALSDLPTLATTDQMGEITWAFSGPDGAQRTVRHEPRLTCVDFLALRDAAVAGLGVALLPEHTCRSGLAKGSLVHVFPQWDTEDGIVHLVSQRAAACRQSFAPSSIIWRGPSGAGRS